MLSDERITLSRVRLDAAKERIRFAGEIIKIGDYKTVANRSYYAVLSAMRAVLALDGFDSKKHSGVIAQFRKEYLKTDVLPRGLSVFIDELVEIHQGSDYNDFYIVTKAEVEEQLKNAVIFVNEVEKYLLKEYENNKEASD